MTGTPTTLAGAIENAATEFNSKPLGATLTPWMLTALIEKHVRDFLAQQFNTVMLERSESPEAVNALAETFRRITKEGSTK